MNTLTLNPTRTRIPEKISFLTNVNKSALVSIALTVLFLSYFLIPHEGMFSLLYQLNIVFIIVIPAAAFLLSLMSLRQIAHTQQKGSILSYGALAVTSLYLIVALAIPFVLFGLYIVYAYLI
jgi:hypothetical protein